MIEGLKNNNLKECQFLHLSKKGSLLGKVKALEIVKASCIQE